MLKTLLKSRISALFFSLGQGSLKNGKRRRSASPIAVGLLIAFLAAISMFSIGSIFSLLCLGLKGTPFEWQIFALASMMSGAISLFGSIFATKTQIFESKDNELLLSMPIPTKYIFASRMIVLVLLNLALTSIVMLPCIVVYGVMCGYTVLGFVFALATYLLIPLLALAFSTLAAWVISEIASRIKNKNAVTVVLCILFFAAYMYFAFGMGYSTGAGIDLSGLKNFVLFYWAGLACANGDALSMLWFFLSVAVPTVVLFTVLDKCFIRIITTKRSAAKAVYKGNSEKSRGASGALLKKEFRRFLSSPAYIMNAGTGLIMIVVMAVIMAFNSESILSALDVESDPGFKAMVQRFLPVIIVVFNIFLGSMNIISAPSISLEDRNLWILQSAPIEPRDVIRAKLMCHSILGVPFSILGTLILCVAYRVGVIQTLLCALCAAAMIVTVGYWGLFLGLKYPRFDWQNENMAVKQGVAVMGTMFGGMLLAIALSALAISAAFVSEYLSFAAVLVPLVAISVGLHFYLMSRGVTVFDNLKKN